MENVYEIVLFEVKNEKTDSFLDISNKSMNLISEFDGYISSSTHRSITKDQLFLDIIQWESLEKAKSAASIVQKEDKFKPFLNTINQIHFFDHLSLIQHGNLKYKETVDNDTLEFALFYLKDNCFNDYKKNRTSLMNHISENYKEFKEVSTLRGINNLNLMLDIAFWEDINACHKAQKELESNQLFIEAFKNLDMAKPPLMEFFKKIR